MWRNSFRISRKKINQIQYICTSRKWSDGIRSTIHAGDTIVNVYTVCLWVSNYNIPVTINVTTIRLTFVFDSVGQSDISQNPFGAYRLVPRNGFRPTNDTSLIVFLQRRFHYNRTFCRILIIYIRSLFVSVIFGKWQRKYLRQKSSSIIELGINNDRSTIK